MMPFFILSSILAASANTEPHPLDHDDFSFCHDEGRSETELEDWCPLLDLAPLERCVGMRRVCEELKTRDAAPDVMGCASWGQQLLTEPVEGAVGGPEEKETQVEPMDCTSDATVGSLDGLIALLKWVVAFLVAFGVFALGALILRLILRRKSGPKGVSTRHVEGSVEELQDTDSIPELPSDTLIFAAKSALEDGEFEASLLLSRAAALRNLDEHQHIKIHRSKTDRQYLRSVRRTRPSVYESLSDVLNMVELCRWAGRRVSRDMAEQSVAKAESLLQVTLILVCLLLGLTGASAQATDQPFEADGHAGLLALYTHAGYDARWRMRPVSDVDDTTQYLVLDTTRVAMGDAEWEGIRSWVNAGGRLLVVGAADKGFEWFPRRVYSDSEAEWVRSPKDWLRPVFPNGLHWAYATGEVDSLPLVQAIGSRWELSDELPAPVDADTMGQEKEEGPSDAEQYSSWVAGLTVLLPIGDGFVVGVSDPEVLLNGMFLVDDNVDFLGAIFIRSEALLALEPTEGRVMELAIFPMGQESPNSVDSLVNARLLPAVIQLLVLMIIASLWLGWPFSPLKHLPARSRMSFSEHPKALGRRYARVGDTDYILATQADFWTRRLGPVGLARAFRREGYDPTRAQEAVERFQAIAQGQRTEKDPIATMEELWKATRTAQ